MRAIVLLCLLQAAFHAVYSKYSWEGPGREGPGPGAGPDPSAGNACKTDQGSCGCCLMLQEVNRLKTYFNTTLDKLEKEYLLTKRSLTNLEESRTAFSVALFSDSRFKCYGPFTGDKNIKYEHVFLNLGGSYNVESGVFTVPRSGVYTFAVTVYSDAGSPGNLLAACASLQVNGQVVVASREQNAHDQEDSVSTVVVLQLKAGDTVAINLPRGCFLCDNESHYNTFSAFLLYATD